MKEERSLDASTKFSILIVICTIGGAVLGASIQGCNNLRQQKEEFQANLVLKSLDAGSQDEAAKYLKFLSDLGVLKDKDLVAAIDTLAVNPEDLPVFPRGNTSPSIHFLGENPIRIKIGEAFVDPGYIATDPDEGDLPLKVFVSGIDAIDTSRPGIYTLTYTVSDGHGSTTQFRDVIVYRE